MPDPIQYCVLHYGYLQDTGRDAAITVRRANSRRTPVHRESPRLQKLIFDAIVPGGSISSSKATVFSSSATTRLAKTAIRAELVRTECKFGHLRTNHSKKRNERERSHSFHSSYCWFCLACQASNKNHHCSVE